MDVQPLLLRLGLVPVPAPDESIEQSWEELKNEFTRERGRRVAGVASGAAVGAIAGSFIVPVIGTVMGGFVGAFCLEMVKGVGPAMFTALGVWLQARYGRRVRLKVGDIEAEARTKEEVEQLIARAQKIQRNNEPKKIDVSVN